MLQYMEGDMFTSTTQVLTITVNCVGAMGKGIALTARQKYPQAYQHYKGLCKDGKIKPGEPTLIFTERPLLLFPTKDNWRNPSQIEWIDEGLRRIALNIDKFDSLALPPLGCGNGGLQWSNVEELIQHHLSNINRYIEIYPPK